MSLVKYYSKKNNTFLLLGVGFLGAGCLDAYHMIVTAEYFKIVMPSAPATLIPWSWFASQLFLSVFLFANWLIWLRDRRFGSKAVNTKIAYLSMVLALISCIIIFGFMPAPAAYQPAAIFHRPAEFGPAAFFALALAGFLSKGVWRRKNVDHWIVLGLIVSVVTQAVIMSRSAALFDFEFTAAHGFKIVSYVCVLTGLLSSMYRGYRRAEERGASLLAANLRFNAALEHMPSGLCMYDQTQRLVVCNANFSRMYNLPPDLLEPGTTLREIIEHRIASGLYAGATPEEYINERFDWVTKGEPGSKTQTLNDGRTLQISHQPMEDGGWVTIHEDITARKEAERALVEREQQFRNLVEGSIQGVFIARNWQILFANQALAGIFGYESPEEVVTLGLVGSLLPPEERDRILSYKTAREKGDSAPEIYESKGLKKDGSIIDIEFRVRKVEWQGASAMQCVVMDITDRKRAENELIGHRDQLQELVDKATKELKAKAEELKQALAKEKELNHLQDQFVSMASHEFRTPLSIIDMSAQRLKSQAEKNRLSPEDAVQKVHKIRTAVRRMTRLMESTLMAARMHEGKIKVDTGPCDLKTLVEQVCATQQEVASNHVITCDLTSDLPDSIQADQCALEQVLTNLLSNAIKYAPDVPEIKVAAQSEGDHIVISVRDRGIGIDEDDLRNIGQRFFRAKTSTGIAGTGIGLNLVKYLVESHGGRLEVESKKGEGSMFTVRLPVAGPEQSAQAAARLVHVS